MHHSLNANADCFRDDVTAAETFLVELESRLARLLPDALAMAVRVTLFCSFPTEKR